MTKVCNKHSRLYKTKKKKLNKEFIKRENDNVNSNDAPHKTSGNTPPLWYTFTLVRHENNTIYSSSFSIDDDHLDGIGGFI